MTSPTTPEGDEQIVALADHIIESGHYLQREEAYRLALWVRAMQSETALNSAAQERPLNTNGGRATGHIGQPSECLTARGEAPRVPARAECDDKAQREWAATAIAMLDELRLDYAPGDLKDTDGVKAIRRLRRVRDEALTALSTQSAELALTQAEEDAVASGRGRPATLAEALSILKGVHKLSPAEQRDIDEAISCIVAFDGITDEMVERAMGEAGPITINFRRPFHEDERTVVRQMLEAVIEGMKPMRSKSAHSAVAALSYMPGLRLAQDILRKNGFEKSALAVGVQIAHLEAQPSLDAPRSATLARWIPVSERMPEEKQDVLAVWENDIEVVYHFNGDWWRLEGGLLRAPSYWMPLPSAPPDSGSAKK